MKIAFDEHIPIAFARVFQALSEDGSVLDATFMSAKNYVVSPPEGDDIPWLTRFDRDGGNAVISGDRHIRSRPHERKAYMDLGLILFIFSSEWNNKRLIVKSAMLLNWWPVIEEHINKKEKQPAKCYEIPCQWNWRELKDVSGPKSRSS